MDKKEILEACMRKAFDLQGEINFDENFKTYGVNSISFIKMLVLLEKELNVEFDQSTFSFSENSTPNQILEYLK